MVFDLFDLLCYFNVYCKEWKVNIRMRYKTFSLNRNRNMKISFVSLCREVKYFVFFQRREQMKQWARLNYTSYSSN